MLVIYLPTRHSHSKQALVRLKDTWSIYVKEPGSKSCLKACGVTWRKRTGNPHFDRSDSETWSRILTFLLVHYSVLKEKRKKVYASKGHEFKPNSAKMSCSSLVKRLTFNCSVLSVLNCKSLCRNVKKNKKINKMQCCTYAFSYYI